MPALRELQFAVADAVIHAAGSGGALALVAGTAVPAAARLAVYRGHFRAALGSALASTFPVVARLVGAAFFRVAAARHARGFPSTSGNLDDYGAGFAAFLAALPEASTAPYLADVARLEWLIHRVGRGVEECALFASEYPVLAIWSANQEGAESGAIHLDDGGCALFVYRRDDAVQLRALSPREHAELGALAHSGSHVTAQNDANPIQP